MSYRLLSQVSNPDNCALFCSLVDLFKINENNQLDSYTIFTCCSEFKHYLMQQDVSQRYAYISEDQDFFKKLDEIVAKVQEKARCTKQQLKYITFIQSVASFLQTIDQETFEISRQLLDKLPSDSTPISQNEVITILDSLNLKPYLKYLIKNALPQSFTDVTQIAHATNEGLLIQSQYTLLGAYLLILKKCPARSPCAAALRNALGVIITNKLDAEVYDLALGQLEQLMSDKISKNKIRFDILGGYESTRRAILELKKEKLDDEGYQMITFRN